MPESILILEDCTANQIDDIPAMELNHLGGEMLNKW